MQKHVNLAKDTFVLLKETLTYTRAQTRAHLLPSHAIAGPSIPYYLFLQMPIDQGCSDCSCAGYDVLYYLCISVSLSKPAGKINVFTHARVCAGGGEPGLVEDFMVFFMDCMD